MKEILVYNEIRACALFNDDINQNLDPHIWLNAFFVQMEVGIDESNTLPK